MKRKPIKIEFEKLCKLYPVEYKQDRDYPQLLVFRNGIIYNHETGNVVGSIEHNRVKTQYGFAHQLVMKNFGTSAPEDMEIPTIDHIEELDFVDDIYGHHHNDDISNLQWMSGPDNSKKAFKNEKWWKRKSKAQKEAQNRPEVRERRSKTLREASQRPEVRERRSKAQKEAQNRPEVREKKSKPIRCIETGVSYSSQEIAAFYLGVSKNIMSWYINGHRSDINGFHFERV